MAGTPLMANCLTDETLTLMAEARLSGDERTLVLDHISRCEDCYRVFVATRQHLLGEAERSSAATRPARTPPAWIMTAAAVLVVGVGLLGWRASRPVPPEGVIRLPATANDWAWPAAIGGAGFGPSGESRRAGFAAGALSADLEIALASGRTQEAALLLRSLGRVVSPLAEGTAVASRLEDQARQLDGRAAEKAGLTASDRRVLGLSDEWYDRGVRLERARLGIAFGALQPIDWKQLERESQAVANALEAGDPWLSTVRRGPPGSEAERLALLSAITKLMELP